jgi:hypothetical protein
VLYSLCKSREIMRINVNLSVQFCSAVELRMNQRLRKSATARHRKETLRRWELFGKPAASVHDWESHERWRTMDWRH